MKAFVEGFQRPFATESIAKEHGQKVDDLIATEATAGKAHSLREGRKDIMATKVLDHQDDFPEPGWRRGYRLARSLDSNCRIDDTVHVDLLDENVLYFLIKETHFSGPVLVPTTSLRNPWADPTHNQSPVSST